MNVYWSHTKFPELAGYKSRQKRIIWASFDQWIAASERKRWTRFAIPIAISMWLIGMVVGAFNCSNVDRGFLLGGLAGFVLSGLVNYSVYLMEINSRRELFLQYLKSETFKFVLLNERVRAITDSVGSHPAADPPEADPTWAAVPELSNHDHTQPVPRFVNLILFMAMMDKAKEIEFSLADVSSKSGLRIVYVINGATQETQPAPGLLFAAVVTVLCNYASIPCYAKGPVRGEIRTRRPDSCWVLESEDLAKRVVLKKI